MLIYRLEDRRGAGVFRGSYSHHYDYKRRKGSKPCGAMLAPCNEPTGTRVKQIHSAGGLSENHIFGFSSKSQLLKAFGSKSGREGLRGAGIVLSVYNVNRMGVLRGTAQVVFDKRYGKKVGELDMVTLEKI